MIRVLQFPLANSKGGMAQFQLRLWAHIDRTQFHFDFVTFSKKLDFAPELLATGAQIFYMPCYAEQNPPQFKEAMNRVLDSGYDIVHLHTGSWKSFLAEEVCMARHVPRVIIHSHSTSVLGKDHLEELQQAHERCRAQLNEQTATDFWSCSREAADWLYGTSIPNDKIKIVRNGIDVDKYRYDAAKRAAIRQRYQITDKIVLGCVANFTYQKNHRFLVDALAQLDSRYVLLFVGSGACMERTREYAAKRNLQERVLFLGYQDATWDFYNAMDAFVLPSLADAFPYVVLAAQTTGLPCFVSDVITHGVDFTEQIWHLPLQMDAWVVHLQQLGIRHDCMDNVIAARAASFDIEGAVRRIEAYYRE